MGWRGNDRARGAVAAGLTRAFGAVLLVLAAFLSPAMAQVKTPTTTTVSVSPNPVAVGLPVEIGITVTNGGLAPVPTGDGEVLVDGRHFGTFTVVPGATLFSTFYPGGGTFRIEVRYSGDANNDPSTSTTIVVVGTPPPLVITTPALPLARVGGAYSQTVGVSGGIQPYSYRIASGRLPKGLSLDLNSGTISGTPVEFSSSGPFDFDLEVSDSTPPAAGGPARASMSYRVAVDVPIMSIGPQNLPKGSAGASYRQQMTASGGTDPYRWTANGLPPGLSMDSNGVISGTPAQPGNFTVAVNAEDSTEGGLTFNVSRSFALQIDPPFQLSITTPGLSDGKVGVAYSEIITASGGTGNYTFSTLSSLPRGLTLSPAGVLSGTPGETGSFTVRIAVTDNYPGGSVTTYKEFTFAITPVIFITPGSLPDVKAGEAYSQSLTATGGQGPYQFTITVGALPMGVTLTHYGSLTGTPTVVGAFDVTIEATDNNGFSGRRDYTLVVTAPTISITPTSLPNSAMGAAYDQTLTASGGAQPYTFTFGQGDPPPGIDLDPGGRLSGTPTRAGNYTFAIVAKDKNGFVATNSYTVTVNDSVTKGILPDTPAKATVGVPYSQLFTASGGIGPYRFSRSMGSSLPPGLKLAADGTLAGTPTASGRFSFTINAVDTSNNTLMRWYSSFVVEAPTIAITPTALPNANGGVAYSQSLTASGGTAPYSFAASGLPDGLSLGVDGKLSGTPTKSGVFNFTVTATDKTGGKGPYSASQPYQVTVDAPAITIGPFALPKAMGGVAYSETISATGGTGPYSFTVSAGALPAGLALKTDGTLSGTLAVSGAFDFTVRAVDRLGFRGEQSYTLTVAAPEISITPSSLPAGTGGIAYSQTITATGGTGPYGFTVSAGALPAGLALKADGTLSGTPAEAGGFNFTVTATDAVGFTGTQAYALAVAAPVPVARDLSATLLAGTSARVNLTAGAAGGPFTAAAIVAAPAAASGTAAIEAGGGGYELVFASAATASGAVAISYTVSNRWGASAPATVTFNVVARPDPARNPEVTGLIAAQVESANRLAASQTRNFNERLERLHSESERQAGSVDIQLGLREKADARKPLFYADDERSQARSGTTLGFPMDRLSGEPAANAAPKAMAFWAGGFVNFGQRDNGGIDIKNTLAGVSGGVDYRFSPRFVGGVGFGYGRDSADVGDNGTRSQAQALSVAVYGSYNAAANVFVDGLLGYSRLDFDSRRFVTDTGDFASGRRDGQQLFGSLTTAYEYRQDSWLLSPYARLDASWTRLDTYTEAGAGPYNLVYGDQSLSTLAGVLGLRAQYAMPMDWGVFTPKARLEFTHDFAGSSRASMGYADLGNDLPYGFDVEAQSRDRLGFGLGFEASVANGWLFGFDYSTALGGNGNAQDHAIAVKLGARW